jgi:hypothetical protein
MEQGMGKRKERKEKEEPTSTELPGPPLDRNETAKGSRTPRTQTDVHARGYNT